MLLTHTDFEADVCKLGTPLLGLLLRLVLVLLLLCDCADPDDGCGKRPWSIIKPYHQHHHHQHHQKNGKNPLCAHTESSILYIYSTYQTCEIPHK